MTTLIPFLPQNRSSPPFQAPVTLDRAAYNFSCWWNLIGRWYYSIADQSGNVVYTGALVGSPDDASIYLAPGVFQTSTILYRSSTGNIEVTP